MPTGNKLYERCTVCDGTRQTKIELIGGAREAVPVGAPCPLCGTGYHEIGITDRQLEEIIEERDALLEVVDRLARATLDCVNEREIEEVEALQRDAARLAEGKSGRAAEYRYRVSQRAKKSPA